MSKFIVQLLKFLLFCIAGYTFLYVSVDSYLNAVNEPAIFVWGDSQVYRGLHLERLRISSGKNVLSAARHGAGMYDFLAFADSVPKEAIVVVGLSKPAQVRGRDLDRNRSRMSLGALKALWDNGYEFGSVGKIAFRQRKPLRLFRKKSDYYPAGSRIDDDQVLDDFKRTHASIPDCLHDKQELYRTGFRWLKSKGCRIFVLRYPYHPVLEEVERDTELWHLTEGFEQEVQQMLGHEVVKVQLAGNADELMHDFTHLNERGASLAAERLGGELDSVGATFEIIFQNKL